MTTVKQEDPNGCGLACVAMVVGKTYAEVRDFWVREMKGDPYRMDAVGNGGGLSHFEIEELIARLAPGKPKPDVLIGSQPMIRTIRSPRGWHWIVVDGDGNVLNPA